MGNPEDAATLEELQAKLEVAEKRHKDTQAAYTKGQQTLKAIEAENKLLKEKVGSMSVKDTEELEELKLTNPDEWYEKKKALESQTQEQLNQELTNVSSEAAKEAELARRSELLEEFNKNHPDMQLTDEVIAFDVPLRINKKLESGQISFEDFLGEVHEFLSKPKKVGDANQTLNQPDLTKIGGGDAASKSATAVDIVSSYKKEIF